jgi:hypothetical protein
VRQQFEAVGTFWAETTAGNKRIWVSFYGDKLSILVIHKLAAPYSTVGTHRARDLSIAMLGSKIASPIAHGFHTSTIAVGQKLSNHRPARQYFFNHIDSPGALKL